jgi:hypothetical protein
MIKGTHIFLIILFMVLMVISLHSLFSSYKKWLEDTREDKNLYRYLFRDFYILTLCAIAFIFILYDIFR